MELSEPSLRRQLYAAVQSYRNGKIIPYVQFLSIFEDPQQARSVLDVITSLWVDENERGEGATAPEPSLGRRGLTIQSSINSAQPSAQELLRIAMCIPAISNASAIAAIKHIQDGFISGRSAIFCTSDIRASLIEAYSMPLTTSSSSPSLNSFDIQLVQSLQDQSYVPLQPQRDVETAIQYARTIAETCMIPYFIIKGATRPGSSSRSRFTGSQGRSATATVATAGAAVTAAVSPNSDSAICLELFPVAVGALATLRRRWNEKIDRDRTDQIAEMESSMTKEHAIRISSNTSSNGNADSSTYTSSTNSRSNSSSSSSREKERRLSKVDIDVLDMLMSNEWHPSGLLTMASAVCEMYPYMKTRHLCEFKRRLLSAALLLQQQEQRDNFAGVLRVCLRLFEQSGDPCWIHVLRVLFANVPASEEHTVESLLEQMFSQASRLSDQIVEIIEVAAYGVCNAFSEADYSSGSSSSRRGAAVSVREAAAAVTAAPGKQQSNTAAAATALTTSAAKGHRRSVGRESASSNTYNTTAAATAAAANDQTTAANNILDIQSFSTHQEYRGIPLPTAADINLLLLISRAGGSDDTNSSSFSSSFSSSSSSSSFSSGGISGAGGEILLPSVLADCTEAPPVRHLRVARALVMTVLCCTVLEIAAKKKNTPPNKNDIDSAGASASASGSRSSSSSSVASSATRGSGRSGSSDVRHSTTTVVSSSSSGGHCLSLSHYSTRKDISNSIIHEALRLVATTLGSSAASSSSASSSSSSSSSLLSSYYLSSRSASTGIAPRGALSSAAAAPSQSWLHYSRAAEYITSSLYCACLSQLTVPCVRIALSAVFKIIQYTNMRTNTGTTDESTNFHSLDSDLAVRISVDLVVEVLIAVFANIETCRDQLLYAVLRGLSHCSDNNSQTSSHNSSRSADHKRTTMKSATAPGTVTAATASSKSSSSNSTALQQQVAITSLARQVFTTFFARLCSRYSAEVAQLYPCIDRMLPTLSMTSTYDLETVLQPVILNVTVYSPQLQDSVLNICRKALLHKDLHRKEFAIRSLVALLSVVAEEHQMQIIQSILHVFSLQLSCRRLLYSELLKLFEHNSESGSSSSSSGSSSSGSASASASTNASSSNSSSFSADSSTSSRARSRYRQHRATGGGTGGSAKDILLSRQVLEVVYKKCCGRLSYFIEKVGCDDLAGQFPCLGEIWKNNSNKTKNRQRKTTSSSVANEGVPRFTVFNPKKCVDTLRIGGATRSSTATSSVNEDLQLLLKLTWVLESQLYPDSTLHLAGQLSETLSHLHEIAIPLSSDEDGVIITAEEVPLRKSVSAGGAAKGGGGNKKFQLFYDRIFPQEEQQQHDLHQSKGFISEFMWAVVRFLALGLPERVIVLDSKGDIQIQPVVYNDTGSSGDTAISSSSTATTTASTISGKTATSRTPPPPTAATRASTNANTSNTVAAEESSSLLAHLTCCHSVVTGFAHCLMSTHDSCDVLVHPQMIDPSSAPIITAASTPAANTRSSRPSSTIPPADIVVSTRRPHHHRGHRVPFRATAVAVAAAATVESSTVNDPVNDPAVSGPSSDNSDIRRDILGAVSMLQGLGDLLLEAAISESSSPPTTASTKVDTRSSKPSSSSSSNLTTTGGTSTTATATSTNKNRSAPSNTSESTTTKGAATITITRAGSVPPVIVKNFASFEHLWFVHMNCAMAVPTVASRHEESSNNSSSSSSSSSGYVGRFRSSMSLQSVADLLSAALELHRNFSSSPPSSLDLSTDKKSINVPVTARLGALSNACHEASISSAATVAECNEAAEDAFVTKSNDKDDDNGVVVADALLRGKLAGLNNLKERLTSAYYEIVSIAQEDSLLVEADASARELVLLAYQQEQERKKQQEEHAAKQQKYFQRGHHHSHRKEKKTKSKRRCSNDATASMTTASTLSRTIRGGEEGGEEGGDSSSLGAGEEKSAWSLYDDDGDSRGGGNRSLAHSRIALNRHRDSSSSECSSEGSSPSSSSDEYDTADAPASGSSSLLATAEPLLSKTPLSVRRTPTLLLAAFNNMSSSMRSHLDRLDIFDSSKTTSTSIAAAAAAATLTTLPYARAGTSTTAATAAAVGVYSMVQPPGGYESLGGVASESDGLNNSSDEDDDDDDDNTAQGRDGGGVVGLLSMTPEEVQSMVRRQQQQRQKKIDRERRLRERVKILQKQAQLDSLQAEAESGQFELLSEGLEERRMQQTEALQRAQEEAVRVQLAAEQQRVASSIRETVRYSLFSVRCEMLLAITRVARAAGDVNRLLSSSSSTSSSSSGNSLVVSQLDLTVGDVGNHHGAPGAGVGGGVNGYSTRSSSINSGSVVSGSLAAAHRWACELLAAVEKGLTIRTFKAYVDVLLAVTENVPANSFRSRSSSNSISITTAIDSSDHTTSSRIASSHRSSTAAAALTAESAVAVAVAVAEVDASTIVETIQNVLRFLDSPHSLLLSSVVNLVMTFCGPHDALLRCEDMIRSIGNKHFFVKETRRRKSVAPAATTAAPADCDENLDPLEDLPEVEGFDDHMKSANKSSSEAAAPVSVSHADASVPVHKQPSTELQLQQQRFVTKKLSEATLGELLKYIEQRLQAIPNTTAATAIIGGEHSNSTVRTVIESSSSFSSSPRSAKDTCQLHGYEQQAAAAAGGAVSVIRICRCIFALFEPSAVVLPASAASSSAATAAPSSSSYVASTAGTSHGHHRQQPTKPTTTTTATPSLMLSEISDRRRNQVLKLAIRYIGRCNRDCGRLLRVAVAEGKGLLSMTDASIKRWKLARRGDGFSDSEIDGSDSDSSGSRGEEEEAEEENDKQRSSVAISSSSSSSASRGKQQGAINGSSSSSAITTTSISSDGFCDGPVDFLFLHGLLSSGSIQALVYAKEWIHKEDDNNNRNSKNNNNRAVGSGSDDDDDGDRNSAASSDDDGDDDDDDEDNAGNSRNKRKRSNLNPNTNTRNSPRGSTTGPSSGIKQPLRGANAASPAAAAAATTVPMKSDKQAHSLVFKIEEFEWRLKLLLQEIDRTRAARHSLNKVSSLLSASRHSHLAIGYSTSISAILGLVDRTGRELLQAIAPESNDRDEQKPSSSSSSLRRSSDTGNRKDASRVSSRVSVNTAGTRNVKQGRKRSSNNRHRHQQQEKHGKRKNRDDDGEEDEEGDSEAASDEEDYRDEDEDAILGEAEEGEGEEDLSNDDNDDNNNKSTSKKKRRKLENDGAISERSRAFIQRASSVVAAVGTGSRKRDMSSSKDTGSGSTSRRGVASSTTKTGSLRSRSRSRSRSRNNVIDTWLEDEDGSDTYADLEDFLVE